MNMSASTRKKAVSSMAPAPAAPLSLPTRARLAPASLASKETRAVNVLRCAVLGLLIVTTITVSSGVYIFTKNHEKEKFETVFRDSAQQVIESFHETLERSIRALDTLSIDITSVAMATNQSFPFVTVPNFEIRGANSRIDSGAQLISYAPIVSDAMRTEWEDYSLKHRSHVDKAYANDVHLRTQQDLKLGFTAQESRLLLPQEINAKSTIEEGERVHTVVDDGTGYHPKIWSSGALDPKGDEPEGSGLYLPLWHTSPISQLKQGLLNWNIDNTRGLKGLLEPMLKDHKAATSKAMVPVKSFHLLATETLRISQYRGAVEEYASDVYSMITYPVFDSFDEKRKLVGIVASTLYWKFLFSHRLPQHVRGIICVLENSYNQSFAYRLDGNQATLLGKEANYVSKHRHLAVSEDIHSYLRKLATPKNRSYMYVGLNEIAGYKIRVYPSEDMAADFETYQPVVYTTIIICVFLFTSAVFLLYSRFVEKRQLIMMETAIAAAQKAAADERDLNEFIAHEVRNPLAAAMSASTFVATALQQPESCTEATALASIREDMQVIDASLHFINDFLRSMLDIQRLNFKDLKLQPTITDILHDVLEPVSAMLYRRDVNFKVIVECPENLLVQIDCLRLKQVVLNLARNSSKFVESGFIRMRAYVVNGNVELHLEDSGPGIPPDKQLSLFAKFQTSLDQLSQGTGVGLCLSKQIITAMDGDLWLDTLYDSNIKGHPGARFVIQLNVPPLPPDIPQNSTLLSLNDAFLEVVEASSTSVSGDRAVYQNPHDLVRSSSLKVNSADNIESLPEKLSVLFVDDDAILRKLFVRAIRKVGPSWVIREAACGEAALQLCETETFDITFVDQYMASIDKQLLGTETVRALRTRGVQSKICGLSANNLHESFANAGADHFILKPMPCAPADLKAELQRILQC